MVMVATPSAASYRTSSNSMSTLLSLSHYRRRVDHRGCLDFSEQRADQPTLCKERGPATAPRVGPASRVEDDSVSAADAAWGREPDESPTLRPCFRSLRITADCVRLVRRAIS